MQLRSTPSKHPVCPQRSRAPVVWTEDLPSALMCLVVAPVSFDIATDYEIAADRCLGRDADGQACFSLFRYVQTALRSDDDELYYEAPVRVETLTAWRLNDSRWLACRKTIPSFESAEVRVQLSLSASMPR